MIKGWISRFCAGLLAMGAVSSAGAHAGHDELEHFAWLKDLVGACWQGEHPDGKTRDKQCFSLQFDHFIRATVQITGKQGERWQPRFESDIVMAWDPAKQQIAYWHWSSNGAFSASTAFFENGALHFPGPATSSGKPGTRAVWMRLDADHYLVSQQKHQDGQWREMLKLLYKRVPG